MATVPTLLIGLGGLGSSVVERVYDQVPRERRDVIAVHAFDTDVNDIEKREHLKGRITQTSKPITVGQYLMGADGSALDWFPHEIKLLKKKTMTDGAGQIRAVSRLAYRASMEDGKLKDVENQISRIFRASGEKTVSSVRVMIVTSLAGGTGAGVFLQTAMYLRELLEKKFSKTSVLVRGAFLLPDTLVSTNTIPPEQAKNVRSNAYACLKELNAMIRNASSQTPNDRSINIEFEYRPDQTDIEGRQAHVISSDYPPYDFCFLYDYMTAKGENLGTFQNYLDQMVDTIFLQLFSPMASRNFSVEDNFILELIGERGANRYCGAGTSRLIYPYEDIIEYLALKWATSSLSNEWLKLDNDFVNEMAAYKQDVNNGVAREEPKIGKRYVDMLDNYAGADRPHPFFTRIYRSTRILDERDKEVDTKAERFIAAVETAIKKALENDSELVQAESACSIDEAMIRNKEKAVGQITEMEANLEDYQHHVFRVVHEIRNFVVNQVVGEDCRAPGGVSSDDDHRLNVWMLKRPEPVHPVAARYMLYQIEDKLHKLVSKLTAENDKLHRGIEQYANKFDDPDTPDIIETPEDRIREALKQGFLKKVLKNKFKDFIDDYMYESVQQLQRLNRYKLEFLKEQVFSEVSKAIGKMIENWEHYFRNLDAVQYKVQSEINLKAKIHEQDSDPTKIYVLASKDFKDRMWTAINQTESGGGDLPADISKNIYIGQYERFCESYHDRQTLNLSGTQKPQRVEEMFRKDVIGWCRDTLYKNEKINVNVVQALKMEADFTGNDETEHFKEIVQRVAELAYPCILSNASGSNSKAYWGIHPDCMDYLTGEERENAFGNISRVEDQAFSPHEILHYKNIYGILAEQIPSFSAGSDGTGRDAGEYFKEYTQRIRKLDSTFGEAVTPHLDKRWHLPAYMPDFNKGIIIADEEKTNRSYLLGLIHNQLRRSTKDLQNTWECYTSESGRKSVTVQAEPIPGGFFDLYKAMFHNPTFRDPILSHSMQQLEEDKKKFGDAQIREHSFVKGCMVLPTIDINIVEAILQFVNEAPAENPQDKTEILLEMFMREATSYFLEVYGVHRKNHAHQETKNLILDLLESSETFRQARQDKGMGLNDAYNGWQDVISRYFKNTLKLDYPE